MEPTFFAPRDIVISLEEDLAQKMIYKSYIKTVANIFINDRGSYVDEETLSQDVLDVVNFEIELAKVVIEILTFGLILFRVLRFLFFSSISCQSVYYHITENFPNVARDYLSPLPDNSLTEENYFNPFNVEILGVSRVDLLFYSVCFICRS